MNKSKQKGTRAETKIVKALMDAGFGAERRALAGFNDKGDVKLILSDNTELTIEVKAGQQTVAPNRTLMEEWMTQTINEMNNSHSDYGALIVCTHRRSISDYQVFVYQAIADILHPASSYYPTFFYFDEFIDWLQEMDNETS